MSAAMSDGPPSGSKLLTMREAVERWVRDGATLVMGAGLEAQIPFAAGYEIIRQGHRDLTLVAPISDMLFDQLVGAGVARRIIAAWVGNVSAGLGHNFRRAVEDAVPAPVEVIDHSNLTFALALHAAAMGVPFLPTYSTLGTDILESNPNLGPMACPFTGDRMVAVRALTPDVAILPVQRADADGNSHLWGNLGVAPDAARAAKRVLVIAEEIVSADVIASDPNRTIIPGFLVSAVVHEPMGCHPSPCQGYYGRDHEYYQEYHRGTRTREDFLSWLESWVLSVQDRRGYLERLGQERVERLRMKRSALSAPADFGMD
jgi:glutaconate CoA-transferase subunit A